MTSLPTATHQLQRINPAQSQMASLVYLAGTIDLKQSKLEEAITAGHQAQIRAQLATLTARFQQQYAEWIKSGESDLQGFSR
jgi:hypothetical protein